MKYITNLRYIGIDIYPVHHQSQQFLTHTIKLQHLIIQKNVIIISINYKIYFYHTQLIPNRTNENTSQNPRSYFLNMINNNHQFHSFTKTPNLMKSIII